jgi:hypothetical protein
MLMGNKNWIILCAIYIQPLSGESHRANLTQVVDSTRLHARGARPHHLQQLCVFRCTGSGGSTRHHPHLRIFYYAAQGAHPQHASVSPCTSTTSRTSSISSVIQPRSPRLLAWHHLLQGRLHRDHFDYFDYYTRSFSHEHRPRGARAALENQYIIIVRCSWESLKILQQASMTSTSTTLTLEATCEAARREKLVQGTWR